MRRYRIKRIATKFFKSLLSCCIKESIHHKRLELFSRLCGFMQADGTIHEYDQKRVDFFFGVLFNLFDDGLENLVNTFATLVMQL